MAPSKQVRVESSPKRVRAYLAGHVVLDTTAALLVWEIPYFPQYYIPSADVVADLASTGEQKSTPVGDADVFDVLVEGHRAPAAAWTPSQSPVSELASAVRFDWDALDAWFEEDSQVYVHPRSPYTRIDALPSSRHVQVRAGDVVVADSRRPVVVFETGLGPRYYLPKTDVRMDLLRPTDTATRCPYKGTASYYSLDAGESIEDAVWSYPAPRPESTPIAGLVSFDSSADGLTVSVDDVDL